MEINTQLSEDGKTLTLVISGKFSYVSHQTFVDSYESVNPAPEHVIIDALGLHSMDSSALGMLLLLRSHAGGDDSDIHIRNCNQNIYKLLTTCKFDQLFSIRERGN